MKRTIGNLKHPMRATVTDSADKITSGPVSEEGHVTTMQYAGSATHAILGEVVDYLQGEEGDEFMKKLFYTQATAVTDVVAKLLLSEDFQEAIRLAGVQLVAGSYQGMGSKMTGGMEGLPKLLAVPVVALAAVFLCLFLLGLLLALWRFALFGLH